MKMGQCSKTSVYKNSDAGELPRRKHTTFRKKAKFDIKNYNRILQGQHGIRGRGTEISVHVRDTTRGGKLFSSGEVTAWKVEEINAEITSGVGCITK